jgi:hypothetical protein
MKKYLSSFIIALLMTALVVSGAFGADGDQLSTNNFRVDGNGYVYYKALIEVATTSDTVTAAESGKIFLSNISTGTLKYTLPTAASGLTYTFTSINGNATSGQGVIYIDPSSADTLVGCVSSTITTTFAAGDSLYSPGATGDTVTIVGASTKWYCINRIGTWVDGNTN